LIDLEDDDVKIKVEEPDAVEIKVEDSETGDYYKYLKSERGDDSWSF
jgi:hypothetical protein